MGRWPVASGDADFAPLLAGATPAVVALFGRFVALARSCGDVVFEIQRDRAVLRGSRRVFASARPVTGTGGGLDGHLNLPRRLDDPRIRRIAPLTSRLLIHHYVVTTPADLDDTFAGWLREAYAVGNGTA
jgi:hypothetical protein